MARRCSPNTPGHFLEAFLGLRSPRASWPSGVENPVNGDPSLRYAKHNSFKYIFFKINDSLESNFQC